MKAAKSEELTVQKTYEETHSVSYCPNCEHKFSVFALVEWGDELTGYFYEALPQNIRFCYWCGTNLVEE